MQDSETPKYPFRSPVTCSCVFLMGSK